METAPLLVELRAEELPIHVLPELAQAFATGLCHELTALGIAVERATAMPLYTPRRLAVLLAAVGVEQPQRQWSVLGPYCAHAFDLAGQPTPALIGFAAKQGVAWQQLTRTTDTKGERFVHCAQSAAVATRHLLAGIITRAIAAIPLAKPMRWGDYSYTFARPVHGLVVLWADEIVAMEAFGCSAGRVTCGHRAMHPGDVVIDHALDYVATLRAAKVLVDPIERRARVIEQVEAAAQRAGGQLRKSPAIIDQVVNLVEWPVAICCQFDKAFLAVPAEALIQTMETHQKFFPVLASTAELTSAFIGVADLESLRPEEIQRGYERVIRPRFADAKFFYEADLKTGLIALGHGLSHVTDQARLGSVADKVERITRLADWIAQVVGVDPASAVRAAKLFKNDLQSRLVAEFPELQGIAGRYYALAAGEPMGLAMALEEAYAPRQAADPIAPSPLGQVLAIAQRADLLASGFATGLKRSGNSDPYGLRRAALGLARTMIESGLELDLVELLERAFTAVIEALQPAAQAESVKIADPEQYCCETYAFILERLRGYYAELGLSSAHFNAVAVRRPRSLYDFDCRIKAVYQFSQTASAQALAAADKRLRNLLRKSAAAIVSTVDPNLLQQSEEQALFAAVESIQQPIQADLAQKNYAAVLANLAQLRPAVDAFFATVRVNDAQPAIRANRLALVQSLSQRLSVVADLEQLAL